SDELDEEEEINQQANIPYSAYPCPAPPAPYPARAIVLRLVVPRVPACRRQADAVRVSFEARRSLLQQCLRVPGTEASAQPRSSSSALRAESPGKGSPAEARHGRVCSAPPLRRPHSSAARLAHSVIRRRRRSGARRSTSW